MRAAAVGVRASVDHEPTSALVEVDHHPNGWTWSVTNQADSPVRLDAVSVRVDLGDDADEVRLFRNGYQSWSPTGSATLDIDHDPSRVGTLEFVRAMHHADPTVADAGELRSEQVVVLRRGTHAPEMLGALGGAHHATTMRVRRADGHVVVTVEAWLGGAEIAPGETRALHPVLTATGDEPSALLAQWADEAGRSESARARAPFQVGWCSWYQWFEHVTDAVVRDNLERACDWPFDVFQVDDGFQSEIGDWLVTDDSFPRGLAPVAADIRDRGLTPGIWIAPFLAAPESQLARKHPEWMARDDRGDPLTGMYNPHWGGFVWQLDVTQPEVLDHLEATARDLRAMGFDYLKLDFTFSSALAGGYADPSRTPAERVRAGYEAVRRGAGDSAFILGCGCPLGAVVGVVDGMRIGPDVAPSWEMPVSVDRFAGYERAAPATRHACASTLLRAPMHRRLWLNDPDCVMLRRSETELTVAQADTWAHAIGLSGGMVLVSDDLSLLGAAERDVLSAVIASGRVADEAALAGVGATCPDLLEADEPTTLEAGGRRLQIAPSAGTSALQ